MITVAVDCHDPRCRFTVEGRQRESAVALSRKKNYKKNPGTETDGEATKLFANVSNGCGGTVNLCAAREKTKSNRGSAKIMSSGTPNVSRPPVLMLKTHPKNFQPQTLTALFFLFFFSVLLVSFLVSSFVFFVLLFFFFFSFSLLVFCPDPRVVRREPIMDLYDGRRGCQIAAAKQSSQGVLTCH